MSFQHRKNTDVKEKVIHMHTIEEESYFQEKVGCAWGKDVLIQTSAGNMLNSYNPLVYELEISKGAFGI